MTPILSPQTLVVLPLLLPLLGLALTAMLWHRPLVQRAITLATSVLTLGAAGLLLAAVIQGGVIATQMGGWEAPFGITLVADTLSAVMVVIAALMLVAVAIHGCADGGDGDSVAVRERAAYHPLLLGLCFGVIGAFLAGDIFNLYVWFEVMLIASFGLLVVNGRPEQLDAGLKYLVLNMVATTLFLIAIAMLYGATGSLNMADLARRVPEIENQGLVTTIAVLFLLAFGMKGAVFPLFFWLPASYHTAAAPVGAIFAALLTKVGIYAIFRFFTLIFDVQAGELGTIMAGIAMLTMVTGVLGAAAHYDIRRILSFHIISQIGYMLVGIALLTPLALAGAVLYIIHHIVVKANLFLVAGAMARAGGSFALERLGGLWRREPLLAVLFLIPALSLAGLPPLSGFWGKLLVIRSGLEAEAYLLAGVALLVGLATLYSMIKIWNEAFWKDAPATASAAVPHFGLGSRLLMLGPVALLAGVTLSIGFYAEPFAALAHQAAAELIDPSAYIAAVLGEAQHATLPGAKP